MKPALSITELREDRKMSQRELSHRTGISPVTLSRYERGRMRAGKANLQKIARALRVRVSSISPQQPLGHSAAARSPSKARQRRMARAMLAGRLASGLSQADVAIHLGSNVRTIALLEAGKYDAPLSRLHILADLYGESLDKLTGRAA